MTTLVEGHGKASLTFQPPLQTKSRDKAPSLAAQYVAFRLAIPGLLGDFLFGYVSVGGWAPLKPAGCHARISDTRGGGPAHHRRQARGAGAEHHGAGKNWASGIEAQRGGLRIGWLSWWGALAPVPLIARGAEFADPLPFAKPYTGQIQVALDGLNIQTFCLRSSSMVGPGFGGFMSCARCPNDYFR